MNTKRIVSHIKPLLLRIRIALLRLMPLPAPRYKQGEQLQIRSTASQELVKIGMNKTVADLHEEITRILENWPVDVVKVVKSKRFWGYEYVTTDETRNSNGDLIESTYPEVCLSPLNITEDELAYLNGDTFDQHAEELRKISESVISDSGNNPQ